MDPDWMLSITWFQNRRKLDSRLLILHPPPSPHQINKDYPAYLAPCAVLEAHSGQLPRESTSGQIVDADYPDATNQSRSRLSDDETVICPALGRRLTGR